MKTNDLVKGALNTAIGVAGGVAGQELGKLVPVETVDPLYTEIGKVVVGGLVIPMIFKKGKTAAYAATFGQGMAIVAGVNLANQYLMPAATPTVAGLDNSGYAIMGRDNSDYALMGTGARSQPSAKGSLVNYAM